MKREHLFTDDELTFLKRLIASTVTTRAVTSTHKNLRNREIDRARRLTGKLVTQDHHLKEQFDGKTEIHDASKA